MLSLLQRYSHAIAFRAFLFSELRRAEATKVTIPSWLKSDSLKRPAWAEDWVHFLRFIRPDQPVRLIDVGANTGYWAEDFLKLFPNTEIVAIEPIPRTFATLQERFAGDERLTAINAAVTPAAGPVEMYIGNDSTLATFHAYAEGMERENTQTRRVPVDTMKLDDLEIPDDGRLLILKVDVQGHEIEALSTAKKLLSKVDLSIIELTMISEYADKAPSFGECTSMLREFDLHPVIFQEFGKDKSPYGIERDIIFASTKLLSNVLGH